MCICAKAFLHGDGCMLWADEGRPSINRPFLTLNGGVLMKILEVGKFGLMISSKVSIPHSVLFSSKKRLIHCVICNVQLSMVTYLKSWSTGEMAAVSESRNVPVRKWWTALGSWRHSTEEQRLSDVVDSRQHVKPLLAMVRNIRDSRVILATHKSWRRFLPSWCASSHSSLFPPSGILFLPPYWNPFSGNREINSKA